MVRANTLNTVGGGSNLPRFKTINTFIWNTPANADAIICKNTAAQVLSPDYTYFEIEAGG